MPSSRSRCFNSFELLRSTIMMILLSPMALIRSSEDLHQHQRFNVELGQDLTLSCSFEPEKIEQVSFMRQMTGDILSLGSELFVHQLSSNEHVQLRKISSSRLDLKLLSVEENDSGIYTCMVNDERLHSFSVNVFVAPRFVFYYPVEASVFYPEASSLTLVCRIYSVPMANITWIYRNKRKQTRVLHQGENLFIESLKPSDSGSFECRVSNGHHSTIGRTFDVNVHYRPRMKISNEKLIVDVNERVINKCQVCSNPQPTEIRWFRDELRLSEKNIGLNEKLISSDSETIEKNHFCLQSTIEFMAINEKQFGRYHCSAKNYLGESKVDFVVEQMKRTIKAKKEDLQIDERSSKQRPINVTFLVADPNLLVSSSKQQSRSASLKSSFDRCFPLFWLVFSLEFAHFR